MSVPEPDDRCPEWVRGANLSWPCEGRLGHDGRHRSRDAETEIRVWKNAGLGSLIDEEDERR